MPVQKYIAVLLFEGPFKMNLSLIQPILLSQTFFFIHKKAIPWRKQASICLKIFFIKISQFQTVTF